MNPRHLATLIRGDEPNFRAARDLLNGRVRAAGLYSETFGRDTNRDLNRWAALKIAFAWVDPKWAFDTIAPTNPGLGSWRWRARQGAKRAPGSQNIPCHENATKLYQAVMRHDKRATASLLTWWESWGLYMRDTAWMGDELMSREYGATVAEAVHAVLELYEVDGVELEGASINAAEVRQLLDAYLNRWYLEHALRAVPWAKQMPAERKSLRTDLQLSVATAGLRSAPQYELVNAAEPLLALMLDWPLVAPGEPRPSPLAGWQRPWSRYPCDDRVAIPALCKWRPASEVPTAALLRLVRPGDSPVGLGKTTHTVTGYHTLYLRDGGVFTWLDADTNHETVPTLVYGINGAGEVTSVMPLGDGPKPHRKVPHSTCEAAVEGKRVTLTVKQYPRGGGEPRIYATIECPPAIMLDGKLL